MSYPLPQSNENTPSSAIDRGVFIAPKIVELFDLLARFDAEDKKLAGLSATEVASDPECEANLLFSAEK